MNCDMSISASIMDGDDAETGGCLEERASFLPALPDEALESFFEEVEALEVVGI